MYFLTLWYVQGTYKMLVYSWSQNIFHMISVLIVFHAANKKNRMKTKLKQTSNSKQRHYIVPVINLNARNIKTLLSLPIHLDHHRFTAAAIPPLSLRCHSVVTPLSIRCRSIVAPLLLCCRSSVAPVSLQCRSVVSLVSLRCRSGVAPVSLRCRSGVTPVLLRCRSAVAPLSLLCRSAVTSFFPLPLLPLLLSLLLSL